MTEPYLLKIQFPLGSIKKSTTVKVDPTQKVEVSIKEIAKSGQILKPEEYLLYYADGTKRKWLDPHSTLKYYNIPNKVGF